jgi:hypothetical protein
MLCLPDVSKSAKERADVGKSFTTLPWLSFVKSSLNFFHKNLFVTKKAACFAKFKNRKMRLSTFTMHHHHHSLPSEWWPAIGIG